MKFIMILLILSVNMGYMTAVAAKTSFAEQMSLNRQLQVDRYTAYKANATVEEINPLLVITQINFPSEAKTVYDAIEHALQRSGYRVDWQQSAEAYDIFSELEMPAVHRKLNLMTLKDAITTLAGDAWQILVDSVNRKLVIRLLDSVTWQIADNSHISEPLSLQRGTSVPLRRHARINDETVKNEMSSRQRGTSVPLRGYAQINDETVKNEMSSRQRGTSVPLRRHAQINDETVKNEMSSRQRGTSVPLRRHAQINDETVKNEMSSRQRGTSVPLRRQAQINDETVKNEMSSRQRGTSVPLRGYARVNDETVKNEMSSRQRGTSVPLRGYAQINDETVKFTALVRAVAPNFEYENFSLSMRQATSDTHVVYRDVFAEPPQHGALSNQLSIDSAAFSEARILTHNNIDSDNGISKLHRVQYIPGHVNAHDTKQSAADKQISYGAHTDKNLWSVQAAIAAKEGVGSLDEAIIVHYDSISVKELIEILIPEGWVVHYEISDAILKQKLVSHAESSRRSALLSLFKELNLKALFYPGQAVVLVAEKEPRAQSFSYGNSPLFKTLENRDPDKSTEILSKTPDASQSQLEVDTILHSAKMIKNLMDEMEAYAK